MASTDSHDDQASIQGDWERASFLSKWTFSLANPMLDVGVKKALQLEDLMLISDYNRSRQLITDLKMQYARGSKFWFLPKLLVSMMLARKRNCVLSFLYTVAEGAVRISLPVVLQLFLKSLQSNESNLAEQLRWAAVLSFLGVAQLVVHHVLFYYTWSLGWNWKSACTGLIYDRLFMINSTALATHNTGKLVNLISNDVGKFEEFSMWTFFFVVAIFEMVAILIILIYQLNVASGFAGVLVTLLIAPIQMAAAGKFASVRSATAAATDQRVRYISEVIDGIASVKSYGWENPFFSLIDGYRRAEQSSIGRSQDLKSFNLAIYFFTPTVSTFATFIVFWATEGELTIPIVFSTLSLIQTLRTSLGFWTRSLERGSEAIASCQRIEKFLDVVVDPKPKGEALKAERADSSDLILPPSKYFPLSLDPNCNETELINEEVCSSPPSQPNSDRASAAVVDVERSSFSYDSGVTDGDVDAVLRNVEFSVAAGELLVVVGPVGSGKENVEA